jgi:hypothetical protein
MPVPDDAADALRPDRPSTPETLRTVAADDAVDVVAFASRGEQVRTFVFYGDHSDADLSETRDGYHAQIATEALQQLTDEEAMSVALGAIIE